MLTEQNCASNEVARKLSPEKGQPTVIFMLRENCKKYLGNILQYK